MFLFWKNFVFHGIIGRSFLLNNCVLSNHYQTQKTRFAVSVEEILYENILLTEMLSGIKVAKKYRRVYCFYGKHFTCRDLRGMLETYNFNIKKYIH